MTAEGRKDIDTAYDKAKDALRQIPLVKKEYPLRVGIIGEYFTVQDAFSNSCLEQKLADLHVEVHRWMTVRERTVDLTDLK